MGEPTSPSIVCRLCTVQLDENSAMFLFGKNGLRYNASGIILKHFDLVIQSTDSLSKYICPSCWAITSNFHELFKRVQQTHHRWLRTDDDPLQKHEAHVRFNGDFEDVQQTDIKLSDNEDDTHEYGDFNLSCDQSDEQASINAIPEGQLDERQEGDDDDDDNKETDTTLAVAIASVDTEALPIRQNEQNDGPSKGAALIKLDCDICGKFFANPYVLATHVRMIHEKVPDQMCHVCARTFKSRHVLEMHQRVHAKHDPPPMQCNICGNWLKHEQSLRMHMELHSQTAQTCPMCDKVLSSKRAMGNHMRYMHSGRLYKCTMCEKAFKIPVKLKEHFAAIHTGEDLYSCLYCPKAFKSSSSMYKHLRKRHWEEWSQTTKYRRVQHHVDQTTLDTNKETNQS